MVAKRPHSQTIGGVLTPPGAASTKGEQPERLRQSTPKIPLLEVQHRTDLFSPEPLVRADFGFGRAGQSTSYKLTLSPILWKKSPICPDDFGSGLTPRLLNLALKEWLGNRGVFIFISCGFHDN
jgi:hypothetical protein